MSGDRRLRLSLVCLSVLIAGILAPSVSAQGMQNVLRARSRVFTAVGPGVSAMRRDPSGRYFILARPASTILVFDAAGNRVDQFPNANSHGATIRYAVGIDVDSRGRLFVVDRGDNAIKIFAPDGSLAATIHVTAPTSVVALSGGQLAVTTLQSKRLVQIMDETGATIRTFGDPNDEPGAAPSPSAAQLMSTSSAQSAAVAAAQPIVDRGRIIGDSAGNIYFAFTSLADPAVQRFDRFGYSAYDSVIPAGEFGPVAGRTGHEVDFGYTMSGLGTRDSVSAWTDLHSLKSVSVNERGGGRGRGRGAGAAAGSGSSATGSASTLGTNPSSTSGFDATALAAAAASGDSDSSSDDASADGNVLSYNADNAAGSYDFNSTLFSNDGTNGMSGGLLMPGMMGMGFGDPFRGGFMRGFGGGGFGGGDHGGFGGHPPDGGAEGERFDHFHPGFATYRATATMRVVLDDPSKHEPEKPVITAVGVDPETHDAWAAISDTLVHLDSYGNRLDMYYLLISDSDLASIKPTSILVEPNRILIASDAWGIFEFPRPDKPESPQNPPAAKNSATPQKTIIAQPIPSAPHKTAAPAPSNQASPAAPPASAH